MSEENMTEKEIEKVEEVEETIVEEKVITQSTDDKNSTEVSTTAKGPEYASTTAVGGTFYNGSCRLCGKQICNAKVVDGKVRCLSCKASF